METSILKKTFYFLIKSIAARMKWGWGLAVSKLAYFAKLQWKQFFFFASRESHDQ